MKVAQGKRLTIQGRKYALPITLRLKFCPLFLEPFALDLNYEH
jgi:hypothetical protein